MLNFTVNISPYDVGGGGSAAANGIDDATQKTCIRINILDCQSLQFVYQKKNE